MLYLYFFIIFIPLIIIFLNLCKEYIFKIKYQHIVFIGFIIVIIIHYFFYLLFFFLIFAYRNYKYYRYYYPRYNASKFFYYRKIVYFSFWRYLLIHIVKNFYSFYIFLKLYIKGIWIRNILGCHLYITTIFLMKFKFLALHHFNYVNLYSRFLNLLEHLHLIFNLDEFADLFKRKFNLTSNKHIEDPILEKLGILKFSKKFFINYPFWGLWNKFGSPLFFFKDFILLLCIYTITLFINLYKFINKVIDINTFLTLVYFFSSKFLKFFSYMNTLTFFFLKKIKYLFLFLFFNIITLLIFIINKFLTFLYKSKLKIFYIFCFILVIKNIWVIHLFFIILYKHYTLNLPLIHLKESIRSFNFEWIDLRNYFNLINLHNSLVDISLYNNTIYNELLKYLHLNLDVYGTKLSDIGYSTNVYLHSIADVKNDDTKILNDIFKVYNKVSFYKKNKRKFFVNEKYFSKIKYEYHFSDENALPVISNDENLTGVRDANWITDTETEDYDVYANRMFYPINKEQSQHFSMSIDYFLYFYSKLWLEKMSKFSPSRYLDLKHLPLSYVYVRNNLDRFDHLVLAGEFFEMILEKFESYKIFSFLILHKKFFRLINSNIRSFYEPLNYRKFFWGHYTANKQYIKRVFFKKRIPTYNLTNALLIKNTNTYRQLYSWETLYLSPEDYVHRFYRAFNYQSVYVNTEFDVAFIKKKFPYRSNIYFNNSDILNRHNFFFKSIKTGSKILKKYMYFYQIHINDCNRFHADLLEFDTDILNFVLIKWKKQEIPFINRSFNLNFTFRKKMRDLDFWSNFYYFKFNKYFYRRYKKIYDLNYNINSMFILRGRKDYYHIRQYFLRIMSSCIFNYRHRNVKPTFAFPVFLRHPELLKYYSRRNRQRIELYYPQINQLFKEFRLAWNLDLHLTNSRTNKPLTKAFHIYLDLFKYRFKNYFHQIESINSYNEFYPKKVTNYKISVLNKISNLKRFFYRQNKYNSGWKIFAYLNCFSLFFHLKHILWHSPYFNILLNNFKSISQTIDLNSILKSNYVFKYPYNKDIIIVNFYSYIFNLFLNIMDIKEGWAYILTLEDNYEDAQMQFLYYYTFYYYFFYGNESFNNLNFLDLYRIFISLFFGYYNYFLLALSRYNYILKYKNYTLKYFFLRYFDIKEFFKYLYIRFRIQVYRWQFWSRWVKRSKFSIFKPKKHFCWRVRKNNFLPFWFYFSEYIKLFIYLLLKYYYSKTLFIYWWLNYKLSYKPLLFVIIKIFKLKLNFNLNIFIITNNMRIHNKSLLFCLFIFFKLDNINININLKIFYDLLKILLMMLSINLDINIKKFFYLNLILIEILKKYFSMFFKFKNEFVFFKPNYYYFRKQRVEARWALDKFNWNFWNHMEILSFIRSTTRRDIEDFSNFSKNFFLLKHLYFYNINSYMHIYTSFEDNLPLSSILFNPLITLKYHTFHFFTLLYIFYIFLYILISILYFKKRYKRIDIYKYKKKISSSLYFKKFKSFESLVLGWPNVFKKKKRVFLRRTLNHFFYETRFYSELKNTVGEFINVLNTDKWTKRVYKLSKVYIFKSKLNGRNYYFLSRSFVYEALFRYWFFLFLMVLPMFFFEYILSKYYIRGFVMKKRRAMVLLRIFLDNFEWYVKLNKMIGALNTYFKRKPRYPRAYYHSILFRKRKKLKRGFFFRWDRFRSLYVKMSPLGSYYYWYDHLNKLNDFFLYYKFFFNSIYKTSYYKFIVIMYLLSLFLLSYRKLKLDLTYPQFHKVRYIRLLDLYNNFFKSR